MVVIHEKSKFASTPYKFETPKELEIKIAEYLDWVDDQNATKVVEYCVLCGKLRRLKETCCGRSFEKSIVHVKPEDRLRPTYYGFASYVGTTRKTLWEYNKKDGFGDVLERFKVYLQADIEQLLLNPYSRNVQGAKFVAINNYGWAERVEMSGKDGGPIEISDIRAKLIERLTKDKDTQGD